MRQVGKSYRFEYHCYEGQDSSDVEAWHRTHQTVMVIARLKDVDELEVGRMYRVRFQDGHEHDVFEDELLLHGQRYSRPAYKER